MSDRTTQWLVLSFIFLMAMACAMLSTAALHRTSPAEAPYQPALSMACEAGERLSGCGGVVLAWQAPPQR